MEVPRCRGAYVVRGQGWCRGGAEVVRGSWWAGCRCIGGADQVQSSSLRGAEVQCRSKEGEEEKKVLKMQLQLQLQLWLQLKSCRVGAEVQLLRWWCRACAEHVQSMCRAGAARCTGVQRC